MVALCVVGGLCLRNNLAAEADDHWQLERWSDLLTTAVQIATSYPVLPQNSSSLVMSEAASLQHASLQCMHQPSTNP